MLREKNHTCNSAIGIEQHRPSGGGLTLGGGQGGLGGLQVDLETPNLTSCLGVEVADPLPPTEVAPSIISVVGVMGAGGGTCYGYGCGTTRTTAGQAGH